MTNGPQNVLPPLNLPPRPALTALDHGIPGLRQAALVRLRLLLDLAQREQLDAQTPAYTAARLQWARTIDLYVTALASVTLPPSVVLVPLIDALLDPPATSLWPAALAMTVEDRLLGVREVRRRLHALDVALHTRIQKRGASHDRS